MMSRGRSPGWGLALSALWQRSRCRSRSARSGIRCCNHLPIKSSGSVSVSSTPRIRRLFLRSRLSASSCLSTISLTESCTRATCLSVRWSAFAVASIFLSNESVLSPIPRISARIAANSDYRHLLISWQNSFRSLRLTIGLSVVFFPPSAPTSSNSSDSEPLRAIFSWLFIRAVSPFVK
ncbi:hypothetical protein FKM82_000291 [Ascaphus truei]